MIGLLMRVCKLNFGDFEEKEFKKFLRMGLVLMMILGIYWMLRPLKDSLFNQLSGVVNTPYAKTVSLVLMVPFVAFYTKLLDFIPKIKMLSKVLPLFYALIIFLYTIFIWAFQSGLVGSSSFTAILGYVWYFVAESFGAIFVALFWSFATDITKSEIAKKGFPLIVAVGQVGGIIFPYFFINLPVSWGVRSDYISMLVVVCLILTLPLLALNLVRKTPKEMLVSQTVDAKTKEQGKKKTGFLEGLRLLLSHKYLIAMFAVNFFFDFIVTVFDFNFKTEAASAYAGVRLTQYYSFYSSVVNIVTLTFLLLGVNKITRYMGLKVSLAVLPVVFGLEILGFLTVHSLTFLFILMVASKAVNYSLNGPSIKQLYIPTTSDVKSKAQVWIESFDSRISKQSGSMMNMLIKPLGKAGYKLLSSGVGFVFVGVWFFIALYLGKTYKKAVDENTTVC